MTERPIGSEYLRWAKTHAPARYDLTSSGVPYLPLRDLPVTLDNLEVSGTGAYGYAPLQAAIAARYGVPEACVAPAMGTSMAMVWNNLGWTAQEEGDLDAAWDYHQKALAIKERALGAHTSTAFGLASIHANWR